MASVTLKSPVFDDVILTKLARELAMDIANVDDILKRYSITPKEWDRIQASPRFTQLLTSAIEEWQSALNTSERIKIKAATMLELWLEHAYELLHGTDTIAGKTELAKFLGRLAGVGLGNANIEGASGERFSLTINLGADQQLKIEKQIPTRTIDHEPPPPTQE